MKSPKIALTCNNYPPEFRGGTERVVQALAHGLQQAGDDVLVVTGTEDPDCDGQWEDDAGVPVVRIGLLTDDEPYGLNLERPRIQRRLGRILDEEAIDVLHVHHWSHLTDNQVRLARARGKGCVVTLHDMWTSCGRFFRLPPDDSISCPEDAAREECVRCVNLDFQESEQWVRKRMARRDRDIGAELAAAHFIVAPSEDCARACLEHRDYSDISVWPDGVPDIQVLPHGLLDAAPPPERGPLGLPLRIGTFGNLNREKGVLDLVDAMRGVRAELHLFGGSSEEFRDEVEARAATLAIKLYWHGVYDEARDRHPALELDLAVFPSRCRETYGLVVDEALHHGTPVIVTASGALPERIARGGGLAVPAGNPTALAGAIQGLIEEREAYHLLRSSIPSEFPTIAAAVVAYRHLYAKAFAAAKVH